jgi:hypothetical protein
MRTASESYKGYEILVVHNSPMYLAKIYPKIKNVVLLNPALPPISRATEKEAFEQARRRIDQHTR